MYLAHATLQHACFVADVSRPAWLRSSGKEVGVATYHMPCQFRIPSVMVIHTSLVAQRLHEVFGSATPLIWQALPSSPPSRPSSCLSLTRRSYCLEQSHTRLCLMPSFTAHRRMSAATFRCGDFNFKPGDAPYRLLTEGTLDVQDPAYPKTRDFDPWQLTCPVKMQSAYKQKQGVEPAFTNWAQTRSSPVFMGTLDYIFVSEGCEATDVLPLPLEVPALPSSTAHLVCPLTISRRLPSDCASSPPLTCRDCHVMHEASFRANRRFGPSSLRR